ncbi:MAG: sulfur relay protein DsrC [Ignavibacteriae bacterium HGW-Ignavibacteriae-3]|nr:MAG: sulfur relay protein DsrC [Ignavibacteriae bacterium HGW-Ignavibacteriae-3]
MAAKEYAGIMLELDADGNLANLNEWNEEIAKELATEEGISLTDRHWTVINYMRNEFKAKGDAPSIRKLTKESGVDTKELYALFPGGPAKKAARISGLPKPKGCI